MSGFESYACVECKESFRAYPDANAAEGPYCSPACESDAKNLG